MTNQTVDAQTPYRIDVHHHVLPRFHTETLERGGITAALGAVLTDWSLEAHLEVMDRNKIAVGMASNLSPGQRGTAATKLRELGQPKGSRCQGAGHGPLRASARGCWTASWT